MPGVGSLFGAHPKIGAAIFDYLHIVLISVHLRLSLVTSPRQLTFKPELSLYFCLMLEGGHVRFRWFHISRRFRVSGFFLVIFNYRGHSPVTSQPKMSSLAWLTIGQLSDVFSSHYFFSFSPSNSPYHVTQHQDSFGWLCFKHMNIFCGISLPYENIDHSFKTFSNLKTIPNKYNSYLH